MVSELPGCRGDAAGVVLPPGAPAAGYSGLLGITKYRVSPGDSSVLASQRERERGLTWRRWPAGRNGTGEWLMLGW